MYLYVGGGIVERCCVVVLILLARWGDDGELGECQVILVDEVFRILKLHAVPVGSEYACLVVGSWHRYDHLSEIRRCYQEYLVVGIVWLQFQMAQVYSRFVLADVFLLCKSLHFSNLGITVLLGHAGTIFIQRLVAVLLLPLVDAVFYEWDGEG